MGYEVRVIVKLLRLALMSPRFSRTTMTLLIQAIESNEHMLDEKNLTAKLFKTREEDNVLVVKEAA